jgi:hypothetical protein
MNLYSHGMYSVIDEIFILPVPYWYSFFFTLIWNDNFREPLYPYPVWNFLKLTCLHLAHTFVENLNLAFSGLIFEINISDQHYTQGTHTR